MTISLYEGEGWGEEKSAVSCLWLSDCEAWDDVHCIALWNMIQFGTSGTTTWRPVYRERENLLILTGISVLENSVLIRLWTVVTSWESIVLRHPE